MLDVTRLSTKDKKHTTGTRRLQPACNAVTRLQPGARRLHGAYGAYPVHVSLSYPYDG